MSIVKKVAETKIPVSKPWYVASRVIILVMAAIAAFSAIFLMPGFSLSNVMILGMCGYIFLTVRF